LSGFASVAWASCAGDADVPGAYDWGGCAAADAAPKIAVTNRAASRITVWTPRVWFQPLDINLSPLQKSRQHTPPDASSVRPRLDRLFDCLGNVRRRCPVGCKKRLSLNAIILHLNDDYRWTREQIVEWLKRD
jgi:hypothetical protein